NWIFAFSILMLSWLVGTVVSAVRYRCGGVMRNDIRARRTERRWSQAVLGKALGVSRQAVIALENDKYDPSLPLAFRIASLSGCSIEEIFTPARDEEACPPPARTRPDTMGAPIARSRSGRPSPVA